MDLITYALLQGSGGGGGTSDYDDLSNQPQVNNVTLVGNKNASDLNLIDPSVVSGNEFDSTQSYAVDDIVIYNAKIYKFISPHAANTPWDNAEVTEIDIMSIVDSIPGAIRISQADYNALPIAEKEDLTKIYYIYDAPSPSGGAVIDDNDIALDKVWSSQKTNTMISQAGGAAIDDTTTAVNKVWSSSKTNTEITSLSQSVTTALADKVDKVNGKGLSTEDYTTAEKTKLSGIASGAEVNTIVSVSVNGVAVSIDANRNVDISALTKAVNDLQNYYLKTETYTKTEVDGLIGAISTITFDIVSSLPTTNIKTNVIYLVPSADPKTKNVKDEYINLDGTTSGWEQIGSTAVDLTGYLRTTDVGSAAFKDVATSGDASATQVVLGNDTRLTDARPASDVNSWAKAANKPTYTAQEVGAIDATSAGTAGGVATLDSNGLIPSAQLPSLSAQDISSIEALIDD